LVTLDPVPDSDIALFEGLESAFRELRNRN
jgi:hypothetical protein